MKQLQLTPPLLIVTMGAPGVGKTFFARQFAEQYDIPRISEDRIRFELFEQPQFSGDEADIISRIIFYTLEQFMQTKSALICEGGFMRRSERTELEKLAKKNGYRVLFVWVQTDVETAAFRSANRDRRNLDSKYAFSINQETFNRVKDSLQRPTDREVAVVISGKHAFKSQSVTVLRKIATLYAEAIARTIPANRMATKPTPRVQPGQKIIQ